MVSMHEVRQHIIKVNAVMLGYTLAKLNAFGQGGKGVTSEASVLLLWALLEHDGQTGQ